MEILSGVYEGKTTGTPIALSIRNVDQRSKDYTKVALVVRVDADIAKIMMGINGVKARAGSPRPARNRA